jgi:dolichol-phosphate mannosyltransferase
MIDGDLQDPPELLPHFYEKICQGYDVVYGIRKKRKENILKRACYSLFYRLLKKISYTDIPLDSGDFSMVSRRVINIINQMPEESRYLRGMRTWVGFKQIGFEYERDRRMEGESKYTLKKLFALAFSGIFNFSEAPIKFVTGLGILTFIPTCIYLLVTVARKIFWGDVPQGFTAILMAITLFGSVQLISIGVIGEYILRIFFQVKKRPLYIVKNQIVDQKILSD